jgi:hypothetical protein
MTVGLGVARTRRWITGVAALALVVSGAACQGLFREYEYEEEIYLKVDGSATVVVNTSLAALSALRGAPRFDQGDDVDRDGVRAFFQSPVSNVTRVSRPWTRYGRRFIQVRVYTDDIRTLGRAPAFAWSAYGFTPRGETITFVQKLGAPAAPAGPPTAWQGNEIVAIRLHVPAKIQYHNAPSKKVERGNIVSWEQPLKDRLAGVPLHVEVRMERESILKWTLTIFGASAAAAATLFILVVWWVRRKGRSEAV